MRWFTLVLISFLLALGAPSAYGAPTQDPGDPILPGLGIQLREIPAALQDDPRARIYIVDNVAPGTSFSRAVDISNQTGRAQPVEVYPGASHIEDEGGFAVEDGAAVNDLTTWMHPSASLAGHGRRPNHDSRSHDRRAQRCTRR